MVKTKPATGELRQWLEDHKDFDGEECLLWPFGRAKSGRARMSNRGHGSSACKIMCEMAHGPAPSPTHQAAHGCGNGHGGCINPSHLSWKTPAGNQADRVIHGTLFPTAVRTNKSGVPGVGWHKKSQRWRAYISENNSQKSLGFFTSFEAAVSARQEEVARRTKVAIGVIA